MEEPQIRHHLEELIVKVIPLQIDNLATDAILSDIWEIYELLHYNNSDGFNQQQRQQDLSEYLSLFEDKHKPTFSVNFKFLIVFNKVLKILNEFFKLTSFDDQINYLIKMNNSIDGNNSMRNNAGVNHHSFAINSSNSMDYNYNTSSANSSGNGNGKKLADYIKPMFFSFNSPVKYLSEDDIKSSLVYTLNGITTDLFPIDKVNDTEGYIIKYPIDEFVLGQLAEIMKILELCLIILNLKNDISIYNHGSNNNNNNSINKKNGRSQCKNSFISEIVNEINIYTNFTNKQIIDNINQISIKEINIKLIEFFKKFKVLNFLNYQFKLLNNIEFLSLLYNFKELGDLSIKSQIVSLYDKTVDPYFKIIYDWVIEGSLNDKYLSEEFFIILKENELSPPSSSSSNTTITSSYKSDEMIRYKQDSNNYLIDYNKLPIFISREICDKIYQIGKTINFIKFKMNDKNWCLKFQLKYSNLFDKINNFNLIKFNKLINRQYTEIIKFFNYKIFNEFEIINEIKYYSKFLLIQKNDFNQNLIKNGFQVFSEISINISSNILNRILQESVQGSSIKNYPVAILNRLDARIIGNGQFGWDVFTLDFRIKDELNFLFNYNITNEKYNCSREYLRIFNFLFKIEKLIFFLNKNWMILKKQKIKKNDKDYYNFKKINLLTNEFLKILNNLKNFINNEIINKNLNKLINSFINNNDLNINLNYKNNKELKEFKISNKYLKNLKNNHKFDIIDDDGEDQDQEEDDDNDTRYKLLNIDEIVELHYNYLISITRFKLFDSEYEYIKVINEIFKVINNFINLTEEYYNQNRYGNDDNNINEEYANEYNEQEIENFKIILNDDIIKTFENNLNILNNLLNKDKDESLRFLSIILSA
ncbi:unnamed protein product [[Candida] boidinii]|uniref:Spindle pole body component n=1 Tax=Candida boidinii TaxID=5477 RepID=A0A9W6WEP7_CANBO|nr:unnamed protein product [[Candida] boidinii]